MTEEDRSRGFQLSAGANGPQIAVDENGEAGGQALHFLHAV